jgi:hypothetical protein
VCQQPNPSTHLKGVVVPPQGVGNTIIHQAPCANIGPGSDSRYQSKVTIVTLRKYCHVFYRRGNGSNTAHNELWRSHVAGHIAYIIHTVLYPAILGNGSPCHNASISLSPTTITFSNVCPIAKNVSASGTPRSAPSCTI